MRLVAAALISILLFSCSMHVEKRRYRSGWNVQIVKQSQKRQKVQHPILASKKAKRAKKIEHLETQKLGTTQLVLAPDDRNIKDRSTILPAQVSQKIHEETIDVVVDREISETREERKTVDNIEEESDHKSLWYFLFAGLGPIAFLLDRKKRLQKWAGKEKKKARLTLVALYLTVIGTSVLLGFLMGVSVKWFTMPISILFACATAGAYLKRKKSRPAKSVGDAFKMNLLSVGNAFSAFSFGGGLGDASELLPEGARIALTLLIIGVAVMAFYGIVFLGCSLMCSGYTAAGWLLMIGGSLILCLAAVALLVGLHVPKKDRNGWQTLAIGMLAFFGLWTMLFLAPL